MMYSASSRKGGPMRTIIVVLPVLLLIGLLCLPALAASLNDTTKVVIVSFQYRDGTVTPAGARVIYGHPPNYAAHRDYIADMAQKNGNVIGSYGIEDPRVLYSDEGAVLKNEVKFSVFLPYAASGDHVDLFDGQTKQKLATADITGAITKFCDAHQDDPDCSGSGSPLLLYGAVILLVVVVISAGAYLLLKKNKTGGN
jgi:hypothetical protein